MCSREHQMREWLSWWSATLPRSRPRVRVPSRALEKNESWLENQLLFFCEHECSRTHANTHGFWVYAPLRSAQSWVRDCWRKAARQLPRRVTNYNKIGRKLKGNARAFPFVRGLRLALKFCASTVVPSCTHLTTSLTTEWLQCFTNQFISIFFQ